MRSVVTRNRLAVAAVAIVAVLAWVRPSLEARTVKLAGAQGDGSKPDETPPGRVFVRQPVTAEAAKVWIKLQSQVPMEYPMETPLEEVVRDIRKATADKDMPDGLMIYLDPIGLQGAEKTQASPISINFKSIRLETGLRLALDQLDLTFRVHPDGLLVITWKNSEEDRMEPDSNRLILNKLEVLQQEITELRKELKGLRAEPARLGVDKR